MTRIMDAAILETDIGQMPTEKLQLRSFAFELAASSKTLREILTL